MFIEDGSEEEYTQKIRIDAAYWDSLIKFIDITSCRLVWDICALSLRNTNDNSWDSRNAESLFRHMVANNQNLYGFQFGNEPGHWYTRHYPYGPTGVQLGKDLVTLKSLIDTYFPEGQKPFLFGPDNCGPGDMTDDSPCSNVTFFTDIVNGGEEVLNGVTIHVREANTYRICTTHCTDISVLLTHYTFNSTMASRVPHLKRTIAI